MTAPTAASSATNSALRIVITGAAGLVGQNLIVRLLDNGYNDIVGIDKHPQNTATLRQLHPSLSVIEADLSVDDGWQSCLNRADVLVQLHAQIGGLNWIEFEANNIRATERVLAAAEAAGVPYLVHASSSVVNSAARDYYTESKKSQEKLVASSRIPGVILRPTLMFGWFDRKHLGWLARFMHRTPVFPIPGSGRYIRQPLYVGDFAAIIMSCIANKIVGIYNISGQERVFYKDLMQAVRRATAARTRFLHIPYPLFQAMLAAYALVQRNPPFTTRQLRALVTPDEFEVIDWPALFGVRSTPLEAALGETFSDPRYATVALKF